MEIYLVGGAVRDKLLNLPVADKDYVVVGATPEQMLANGFYAVGKDFPVFLHPKSKEEYALARTERKIGVGYKGFECHFAVDVTLKEDLLRRDLTINAIAQDNAGNLIDPFNGLDDLNNKVLRHVSPAFSEDPLRVLRVARFFAKFAHLGFRIAPETLALMRKIVEANELENLTAERIWQEWFKSLQTKDPQAFIDCLHQCGALKVLLPEIDRLFGVPQSSHSHPEIDTGKHCLLVSKQAAKLTKSELVRFAAQLHDLGKGVTDSGLHPKHPNHEQLGKAPINALCTRIKVPSKFKQLALLACLQHTNVHKALSLSAREIVTLFDQVDLWRHPERFHQLLIVCRADHLGRFGFELSPYPQKDHLLQCAMLAQGVSVKDILNQGITGAAITQHLTERRIKVIERYLLQIQRNT